MKEYKLLKINEIQCGDIVLVNGNPVEVVAVNEMNDTILYYERDVEDMVEVSVGAVRPMRITREMLTSNGFIESKYWYGKTMHRYHVENVKRNGNEPNYHCIDIQFEAADDIDDDFVIHKMIVDCETEIRKTEIFSKKDGKTFYVHELQHLFRQVGVDKPLNV